MSSPVMFSHFELAYLRKVIETHYVYFRENDFRINLYNQGFNMIYLLTTDQRSWMFRLRPHYPYYDLSGPNVAFALEFQEYLLSNDFNVPEIMPLDSGDLCGKIDASEGHRYFSIHRLLDGKTVYPMSRDQTYNAGRQLANMHLLSQSYRPEYSRLYFSKQQMLDIPHQLLRQHPEFLPENYKWFNRLLGEMKQEMAELDFSNYPFVILHGDFWYGNLIFDSETISLIDFDFSGYGPRELDIASFLILGYQRAMNTNDDLTWIDRMYDDLVEGYTSVWSEGIDKRLLVALAKMRVTWIIGGYLAVIGIQSFYGIRERLHVLLKILDRIDTKFADIVNL